MKFPKIMELAKGQAEFVRYQDGQLFYEIPWTDDDGGVNWFMFPVPVTGAGEGEFLPIMKGISLLRWIRPHLAMLTGAIVGDARGEAFDQ